MGLTSLPSSESNRKKKILVVDDEEAIVELLRYNLRQKNYDITTAFDGKQALDTARFEMPDLIILDFMLPILNGPEVAEILKSIPVTADIPIIFLTARNDQDSVAAGFRTGASDYVTKPFNIGELLARVETQLKLKEVIDQLKKTENDLREANSIKDKLFAVFIHDIRSPFHALGGYISILHHRYEQLGISRQKKIIGTIQKGSVQIQELLENLLQWSRMESNLFEFRPRKFNLLNVITRILNLYSAQLKTKGVVPIIEIDHSVNIHADEVMTESIVRNLLLNAIKFTPDNGTIKIQSRSLGDFEEVSISDSGVGISEENQKMIFNKEHRFTKLGLNGETGAGLGLILCKEFIQINGGEISVNSIEGKGSNFRFTLPRSGYFKTATSIKKGE